MASKTFKTIIATEDAYTKKLDRAKARFKSFGKDIGRFIKKGALIATAAIAGISVALAKAFCKYSILEIFIKVLEVGPISPR